MNELIYGQKPEINNVEDLRNLTSEQIGDLIFGFPMERTWVEKFQETFDGIEHLQQGSPIGLYIFRGSYASIALGLANKNPNNLYAKEIIQIRGVDIVIVDDSAVNVKVDAFLTLNDNEKVFLFELAKKFKTSVTVHLDTNGVFIDNEPSNRLNLFCGAYPLFGGKFKKIERIKFAGTKVRGYTKISNSNTSSIPLVYEDFQFGEIIGNDVFFYITVFLLEKSDAFKKMLEIAFETFHKHNRNLSGSAIPLKEILQSIENKRGVICLPE